MRRGPSETALSAAARLACFVLCATGACSFADPTLGTKTPTAWLQAMDGAFRTLDYDGTFSYYATSLVQRVDIAESGTGRQIASQATGHRGTEQLATFRIVHKVIDGVERERIVHLNGPAREILRTGDDIIYVVQPGDALLDLEGTMPAATYGRVFARRFENVDAHYDVAYQGDDRVAGRAAVRLAVVPKDEDRLGYRLWIDRDTGLLLRSDLQDPSRANLEIFQFNSLTVGDAVNTEDLAAAVGTLSRPLATAPPSAATFRPSWGAHWVPAGFEMTSASAHPGQQRQRTVTMLTFSDGLAAFSVFVEAMPETGAGHVVSRNGATVALTHMAASDGGDHLVTVVGEVPVATARRIAANVHRGLAGR